MIWRHGVVVITTAQLHSTKPELRFKPCSRCVGDSRWWGSLTMVPAGNKAERLSSVNHTTKTTHHHQAFIRIYFFREKRFNCFPKFFIVINVINAKIVIMSFFGTSNEFYTTITLLIICSFIFIRSTMKKFISQSWLVIISLLISFVKKGAWFAKVYFFLRGAWQSIDFLHASGKPIKSPFKMPLLDISLIKWVLEKIL